MILKKSNIRMAVLIAGVLLVSASVILLVASNFQERNAIANAEKVVGSIRDIMPEVRDGVIDDRANLAMPTMEIDGVSYCGIVELPAYNTELPIYSYWDKGKVSELPCRYSGSIYDGSLVIGASDSKGQFDFMQTVTTDDVVCVTDMTGAKYTYAVAEIERGRDVSTEYLTSDDFDLTLFAKNTYSFDYTIVRCKLK